MKLFQTVRRVFVTGSGSGFVASVVQAGVSFANRFTLLGGTALPAVSVDASRFTVQPPPTLPALDSDLLGAVGDASVTDLPAVVSSASLRDHAASSTPAHLALVSGSSLTAVAPASFTASPAVDSDLLGAVGTAAIQSTAPAVGVGTRLADLHLDANPAAEIVQIVYDLARRVGGNASADVTGTWATRANAEGAANGTDATSTGAALGASRKLRLDYANHTNKTALTITSVKLLLYIQSAGNTAGLLGSVTMSYNIGAGEVIPTGWNARTDTFDFTTTPAEVDITAAVGGDWSKLDSLQTFVLHTYGTASLAFVCSVDAIELQVVATATQIP